MAALRSVAALALAGWLVAPAIVAAQTDFPLPIFETGGNATAFAYGDLNGDGRPDAAVVHSATDKLGIVLDDSYFVGGYTAMVWHADGQGGFTRQRYFSEPSARSFVTDADQDGRPDLLTVQAADILFSPQGGDGHVLLNHTLQAAWTDFGHGLAGSFGVPRLAGQGTLKAGSPGALKLTNANPNKLAVLFIGASSNPTPFKGGVLVPVPVSIMFMLATSPSGAIALAWNSWKLMPPGTDWFFQFGIVDSAGPAGASLSNAVRALQP